MQYFQLCACFLSAADELEMSEDEDELSTIDDATPTVLPALKSLGIGGNDISDETAEAFGNMLLENDSKYLKVVVTFEPSATARRQENGDELQGNCSVFV